MAGYFLAEGDLVIERALDAGHQLRSVLVAQKRRKPLPEAMEALAATDMTVFEATDAVLVEVTGRPELRDPIGCFTRPPPTEASPLMTELLAGGSRPLLALLEGVNNPNNLGVIMRNAAGLGVDAVLLDPTCADPLYRRAIRSSMGQVFALPHARIPALPDGLDRLHERGIVTVALSPGADTTIAALGGELATPAPGLAVVLGAEGFGLNPATIDACTYRARIPMTREVDSLNVASAAAVAFHALR